MKTFRRLISAAALCSLLAACQERLPEPDSPVSFEGEATFSQKLNEDTGVRIINIQNLESGVTVTFNGYSL